MATIHTIEINSDNLSNIRNHPAEFTRLLARVIDNPNNSCDDDDRYGLQMFFGTRHITCTLS